MPGQWKEMSGSCPKKTMVRIIIIFMITRHTMMDAAAAMNTVSIMNAVVVTIMSIRNAAVAIITTMTRNAAVAIITTMTRNAAAVTTMNMSANITIMVMKKRMRRGHSCWEPSCSCWVCGTVVPMHPGLDLDLCPV